MNRCAFADMTCLIVYDISDNRIRTKLANYLKKKGKRLQKSVFAVELERHAFKKMLREIRKIISPDDQVAVIRLCKGCMDNALQTRNDEDSWYIF